jgi:RNA polymerase-binding transcription factor
MTTLNIAAGRASFAIALLDRLEEVTGDLKDQLATLADLRRGLATHTTDVSDGSVKATDVENAELVAHCLQQRRDQLREALARIGNGTYGTCANCSHTIPAERLLASPAATLCVTCQSTAEQPPWHRSPSPIPTRSR